MSTEDLKCCPFCGGEADPQRFGNRDGGASYAVWCYSCLISTPWMHGDDGKQRAIEAWNRRAAPAAGTGKDAARLADGYESGFFVSDPRDGYAQFTLHYKTAAQAEAAYMLVTSIIDSAIGTRAKVRSDTARLDFMIEQECQIEHIDRISAAPLYRVRWPWEEREMRTWSATPREAIDAAIAAKEPPCGS